MNSQILLGLKHNLFGSLSQLELLWKNDVHIVKMMETLIKENISDYSPLKKYVRQHYQYQLNQTPNIEYLGHPINAYHLIRHIVYGWEYVSHHMSLISKKGPRSYEFNALRRRKTNVDEEDIDGAAVGIARLVSEYSLDLKALVYDGRLVTTLENGRNIESLSSTTPLDGFDLCKIAEQALKKQYFYTSVIFYELCVKKLKEDESQKQNIVGIFKKTHLSSLTSKNAETFLNNAMTAHDKAFKYRGQAGQVHRCNSHPLRGKINNTVKNSFNLTRIPLTVNITELWYYNTQDPATHIIPHGANETIIAEKLCRGGQIKASVDKKSVTCYHASASSSWLRLGPMKIQDNSNNPYHAVIKELVYDHECDRIKRPLTVSLDKRDQESHGKPIKSFEWMDIRVMKNVRVDERTDPVYDKINRRIEHLTTLSSDSTKMESEHMLCGNYGIGGSYWTHVDQNSEMFDGRLATIVTVIEAPMAGGATVWPYIGVSVFPEKGDGIYWYNLLRKHAIDGHSGHRACPVMLGSKWICNKWIGYDAQWKHENNKCALTEKTRFYPAFYGHMI